MTVIATFSARSVTGPEEELGVTYKLIVRNEMLLQVLEMRIVFLAVS